MDKLDLAAEKAKMINGELYTAFIPELTAERARCAEACHIFNTTTNIPHIERVNLFNKIIQAPPLDLNTPEEKFQDIPWIQPPFVCDYGYNITLGEGVYINFNCTILDTCKVKIGSRTLFGPSVSLFAASHPTSAALRNGTRGPEFGKPITIGDDCWLCGNVIVLAGVTIGDRSIVGAGSVVTKDVPPDCIVAGNPAKIIRRLEVEGKEKPKDEVAKEKSDDVKKLLEKMEKLELEMKSVKEELKKHL